MVLHAAFINQWTVQQNMDLLSQFVGDLDVEEYDENGTHFTIIRFRPSSTPAVYQTVYDHLVRVSLEYPMMTVHSTPFTTKKDVRIRRKFRNQHNQAVKKQKRRDRFILATLNELSPLGYTMEELEDGLEQYLVPEEWQIVVSDMSTAKCVVSWPLTST